MGVAAPALLEGMPVVARGGDGHVAQRQRQRRGLVRHAGHGHAPGLVARALTAGPQLAAHLDEEIGMAQRLQALGDQVHRIAFGNAAEVHMHGAGLQRAPALQVQHDALVAHALAHPPQCIGIGDAGALRLFRTRAEAPQINQRPHGGVPGAATGLRPIECAGQHGEEFGRQHMPAARLCAVEARDVGISLPVAHLAHDQGQRSLYGLTCLIERAETRVVQAHAPGRAHGLAGECLQRGGVCPPHGLRRVAGDGKGRRARGHRRGKAPACAALQKGGREAHAHGHGRRRDPGWGRKAQGSTSNVPT